MEFRQQIFDYIVREYFKGHPPDDFADDYDLIDHGILDSLAVIDLTLWLEETMNIEVADNDLGSDSACSIDTLISLVQSKQEK